MEKDGGVCTDTRERATRFDSIFTTVDGNPDAVLAASHDLTCGEDKAELNCRVRTNPAYYSDHRLVWAKIALQ